MIFEIYPRWLFASLKCMLSTTYPVQSLLEYANGIEKSTQLSVDMDHINFYSLKLQYVHFIYTLL